MSSENTPAGSIRVKVFVDFWNFQLSVNDVDRSFRIDWEKLGLVVAEESLRIVNPTAALIYQGMNVYGSYSASSPADLRLRQWAMNTLNRMPGVEVTMPARQNRRRGPVCPSCRNEIGVCPVCGADFRGTEEKGVDTRIATDMISLAWVDNYDVAALLSSDRDFVPVVEFLGTRGIKTIHGAFRNQGAQLTQTCWGNFQVPRLMPAFARPASP